MNFPVRETQQNIVYRSLPPPLPQTSGNERVTREATVIGRLKELIRILSLIPFVFINSR